MATGPTPDKEALRRRLEALQSEHRDLDDVIARISGGAPFDVFGALPKTSTGKIQKFKLREQASALANTETAAE